MLISIKIDVGEESPFEYFYEKLLNNASILIVSKGEINLDKGTAVKGSRVAIYGDSLFISNRSVIDSTG